MLYAVGITVDQERDHLDGAPRRCRADEAINQGCAGMGHRWLQSRATNGAGPMAGPHSRRNTHLRWFRNTEKPFTTVSRVGKEIRQRLLWVLAVVTSLLLGACQASPAEDTGPVTVAAPVRIAAVCDHQPPGPEVAPAGAVVVDPAVVNDLSMKTEANPPAMTFWLAPGRHTLGNSEFGQVAPKTAIGTSALRARFLMGTESTGTRLCSRRRT